MSAPELLALSLVLSVAASALAWIAGALIERASPDPRLRDRVWGAGLLLGVVPPLAVAALLLAPAPVREIAAPTIVTAPVLIAPMLQAATPPASAALPDLAILASLGLAVAVALGLLRFLSLGVRIGRLVRLLRHAAPADPDLAGRVEALSRDLQVRPPRTVISATVGEALLSGLGRPCLILPQAPDGVASDAVIAHELAHLKRGDHRTLWREEALVILLAINPLVPVLRARRDAAREEACDALALKNAEPETRRLYARTLIEALKTRAGPKGMGEAVVALTFTGAGRTSAMNRLKAVMTPAAPAGRRARLIALSLTAGLVASVGAASWAVADQRPVRTVVRADAGAPTSAPDAAYVSAAFDPVYRAAWPEACGFGSESDGRVFVFAGDCATGDGSRIEILSLAGVPFSTEARVAFAAVKAACDAGRPVEIAYDENGVRDRVSVACLGPAVAPPEPVRFTIDLTYDPAIRIAAGDTLEIDLRRDMEGGGTASKGMVLDLAPGALPGQAFADLRPPLLPADLRTGPMFNLSARIVGADGAVKAVADRDLGRPHAPYISSARAVSTAMRMLPADIPAEEAAARRAAQTAAQGLPPEVRARFQRASASDYRTYCASADPLEEGFCAGVLFSHLSGMPGNGLCVPEASGGERARLEGFVARGKAEIARLTPRRDEGAYEYSERALKAAYACPAAGLTAALPSPAEPRAYQARITISANGQVVAAERLRIPPDNRDASTILTADGRDYRFELRLARAEPAPGGQPQLALGADVARAASAGGWEPEARPALLMRPDGTARMQWGSEAGLSFEILVEPA